MTLNFPSFIHSDHVNRKTQYENPVLQAKRSIEMRHRIENASNYIPSNVDIPLEPLEPKNFFTKNPAELLGERIQTTIVKSQRGLGFTGNIHRLNRKINSININLFLF